MVVHLMITKEKKMTKRQKIKITNAMLTGLKIVSTVFVFVGLTLAMSGNFHMEIYSLSSVMIGCFGYMIHSFKTNDHMILLISVAGFTLAGNLFLETPTAILIAEQYGIALTEEKGWFAQYGNVLVSIIKELV